jgi:hypothetical protein
MAGLTEFYCAWNEPSHASQFKWLEYTFKTVGWVESFKRQLKEMERLVPNLECFLFLE